MGNKSSAQAGFLWLHPSPYSSSRISTSERESSGRSAAAAREPLPTWFEVNPLDQELRWQCASIDDIILEGADSKEVEDGPDALVHRPTAAPTIQGQLSLASVRSVRALAASSDSSPYVFVMEGTNGRSPWKLTLQAADAVSMLSWVSFFRRFVTVEKPLSDVASMVFHSIRIGDVAAAFEALVRLGRVPAPRDGNGNTPLLAAACIGNVSLLQQLILAATGGLRATGTLRDVNLDGWSVLHCAAGSGTSRAVKAVLAALSRVDPAARSGPISGDALLEAPRPGGSIPAAAFHDVEASVTDVLQFRCLGGMTALHVAASRGRDPVLLRLLAQAGVNCFLCDDSGRSLAHYIAATVRSQPALVEEDEWGGSAVEEPDEDSAAAALCAQWVTSAVPELLDWRDSAGNTPLHTAALHGRLECVRIFLQSAADPLVRNAEGATPASVAAGCGYVACLRLLTRYGDEASTTHSMTLSAQRRAMMAAALSLSGEFEVVGRLDRIAAVWERVLNSAVNRTDKGPAGRDLVSSTRGTGRDGMMLTASDDDDIERLHVPDPEARNVTSPVTKGYPQQVTSGSALPQWYRSVDSTSGCVYFWNEFGESLWSSARSASVAGDASTPWTRMIDASSGYSYMCDSVSGLCEWVNEPAVGGAGVAATTDAVDWWVLKIDPASGAGYFENARTFESEWCYEASVPDWLGSVSDPEMNAWSRSVDSSSGMSFFTNWRTSVVVWGAPLLA